MRQPQPSVLQAPAAFTDGSVTAVPDGTLYYVTGGQIRDAQRPDGTTSDGVLPEHITDLLLHGYTLLPNTKDTVFSVQSSKGAVTVTPEPLPEPAPQPEPPYDALPSVLSAVKGE